jgi:hypothetical protein
VFSGSVYLGAHATRIVTSSWIDQIRNLGILLGYFTNYGTSRHIPDTDDAQWLIPNSLHIIFAALILFGSLFTKESPRYLVKKDRMDDAKKTLAYFRNMPVDDPYVINELDAIKEQYDREVHATSGGSFWAPFQELFTIPSNQYRIMIGVMCQILGQWSGGGSFTVYARTYLRASVAI